MTRLPVPPGEEGKGVCEMLVSTTEQYQSMLEYLRTQPYMVCDLETTGLDPWKGDRLIGVAILVPGEAGGEDRTYYAPFRHGTGTNLPIGELFKLAPLFADPERVLVGFNLKFDMHFIEVERMPVFNQPVDVMLAAHLANENEPTFQLKRLGAKYIDPTAADAETELMDKLAERKLKKGDMWRLSPEDVGPYAEQDVVLTWELAKHYQRELEKQRILYLWDEVNLYMRATLDMERNGALVDPARCQRSLENATTQQNDIYSRMRAIVGADFNPASVPQLRKILNQEATNKEALAYCPHPIAPMLLEHRSWSRAANTYYQKFLDRMDDGCRLHPNLSLIGTISGRLSCSTPNLQALPRGNDIYKVRDLVVASNGFTLMAWDWSQAELRLLAHYTQDPFLLDAYTTGKDIHQETADLLGIPRNQAKRVNFGIVYGIGANSLATQIGTSVGDARGILNKYHKMIPGVRRLSEAAEKIATRDRRIPMWTGRFRHYEDATLGDETHKAMSNLIQGGVAEMMRVAVTRLHFMLQGTRVRMLLQVHDEILFEVPSEECARWAKAIRDVMQDFNFAVPIISDGKMGQSWGTMGQVMFDEAGEVITSDR